MYKQNKKKLRNGQICSCALSKIQNGPNKMTNESKVDKRRFAIYSTAGCKVGAREATKTAPLGGVIAVSLQSKSRGPAEAH